MANHLWIPLSSSTSAPCWSNLKHIFVASAALNCLFFFPFSEPLLSPLFCQQVLWKQHPLWFRSNDCLAAGRGLSCGEQSRAMDGQTPPWTPHRLGRGCSVHGIEQTFLPARWERVAPRLTGIISWHCQLVSCGVKFLPQALPPW